MKFIKSASIILIIGAGLIGSYWIIKDVKQTTSETAGFSFSLENAVKPGGTLFQYIEKTVQQFTGDNSGLNNIPDDSFNLTKSISQNIFQQIQSTGLPVATEDNVLSADVNLTTNNLVGNVIKNNLPQLNFISHIDSSKIKISQDNSREAQIKYLDTIQVLNKKNTVGFDKHYLEVIIDVFQKLNMSSAVELANVYKDLADDYLNLEVPSDLLSIHQSVIVFYKNSETVYRAMSDYINDPIKGYMALEMVEGLLDELVKIQNIFNEKIKEIKS